MASFQYETLQEEQLETWFDHLDEVFEKTPRQYFVRHWQNDPQSNVNDILVALDVSQQPPKIASTVRIYRRNIFVEGKTLKAGAIGEVSTKKAYQGQGLAGRLLTQAEERMKSEGFALATLHTGAAMPLYKKYGYISAPREMVIHSSEHLVDDTQGLSLATADLQDDAQVKELAELHDSFASDYNGTFQRGKEYTKKWFAAETTNPASLYNWVVDKDGKRVAFLFIGYKHKYSENTFVVRSYAGVPQGSNKDNCILFRKALKLFLESRGKELPHKLSHFVYPAPIFNESQAIEEGVQLELQEGAMYNPLDSKIDISETFNPKKHLFWDADSF